MTATIDDVRQELGNIAKWAPKLPASWSDMPVRASRIGDGVHVRMSHAPLPGGMERAVDTWDLNGPLGIHTQVGIRQALGPWQDELRGMGGPAMLGSPVAYLVAHLDWARAHMPAVQWDMMGADIRAVWERVQHLVCPDKERSGTCPECGARIEWVMGSEGRVNIPLCPNRCKVDMRAGLVHAQRHRLAHADDAPDDAVVTLDEARRIWPKLNANTIRSYIHRHQLERVGEKPPRYRVRDLARLIDSQPTRRAAS